MDTRTRLIEATQSLLWDRGYAATSPRDIQSAAGAGQGSMYHHFAGKQGLAAAALARSAVTMQADAETLLHGTDAPLDRLIGYLVRQRDAVRGCQMGRMTYDRDVLAIPQLLEPVQATFTWLVATLGEVIGEAQDAGQLSPDLDRQALAAAVAAVVQGGYVLARAAQDPHAFDQAVAGAVDLLHRARA